MGPESPETEEKRKRPGDVMHHFFRELPEWIEEMEDPRHPSYITYQQSDLFYMGLLKNLCGVKTLERWGSMPPWRG